MTKHILEVQSSEDGYIDIFEDLATISSKPSCGIVDNFRAEIVRIKMGDRTVELPANYEILQTEEGEIDFVPAKELLDIPLFSAEGKFAINEISRYECTVGEEVDWVVPSIQKGHYFILDSGIVVNPYPSPKMKQPEVMV